jgi:3',5'-cyclic AMP phosphodiesterase CpdA
VTSRILHLSDLHFGRHRPALVEAVVALTQTLAPDLIAISGDLTQRARRRELDAARAFLARLPGPLLRVPGNHDMPGWQLWERFGEPWRKWCSRLGPELEPVVETPGLLAVGVNTARPGGLYRDWSRGRIDADQVKRIEGLLAAGHAKPLRLLVAHHPLLLTPAGAHRGLMGNAEMALPRLRAAGLDLALGGHVHLGYAGVVGGVVIAHAGTGTSDRLVGEPNGCNLITGDGDRIEVAQWQWHGDGFAPAAKHRFLRRATGWAVAG